MVNLKIGEVISICFLLSLLVFGGVIVSKNPILTGFAVLGDDFISGNYENIKLESGVLMLDNSLSGTFTSQVFDAGNNASWNSISWAEDASDLANISLIYAAQDKGGENEVFSLDDIWLLVDMKDEKKNFYLNFSNDLTDNSILKIYAKKDKGIAFGVYAQSDIGGTNPLGIFTIDSLTGEYYTTSLDISVPTNAIWLGEGTGAGIDPRDYVDYIYAESLINENIIFYVRSCDDSICGEESWIEISENPQDLNVNENRYLQYMVDFSTDNIDYSPELSLVEIDYTLIESEPEPEENETIEGQNETEQNETIVEKQESEPELEPVVEASSGGGGNGGSSSFTPDREIIMGSIKISAEEITANSLNENPTQETSTSIESQEQQSEQGFALIIGNTVRDFFEERGLDYRIGIIGSIIVLILISSGILGIRRYFLRKRLESANVVKAVKG